MMKRYSDFSHPVAQLPEQWSWTAVFGKLRWVDIERGDARAVQ